MSETSLEVYLYMIEKSNEAFRDFLEHLPVDALEWKVSKYVGTANWIIHHVIRDQEWFARFIVGEEQEELEPTLEVSQVDLEVLLNRFDKMVETTTKLLKQLKEEDLEEVRSFKNYSLPVKELLFEYIHHLNHHGGQLALIINSWKRKQRALED
ncbi:MAG: DinB family protein [Candidatus Heimdallarchaeaceae archaeon]